MGSILGMPRHNPDLLPTYFRPFTDTFPTGCLLKPRPFSCYNAGAVTRKGTVYYNRIPKTNEPAGYSAKLTGWFSVFIGGNKDESEKYETLPVPELCWRILRIQQLSDLPGQAPGGHQGAL